ncbi:uncharacterized protein SAPINGB_P005039 [Magnusiomyces paraingens]|uniref:Mitochondrial FAD carrier protein FLX1 n=1 Tax=Magnusiomyces paraingens TaxID=2606893 RepID=A0A5E8C0H5_9ASCO|nr:uncharacterized protein SAPINGB_P005039 [Saprochaete ingens]VVT56400.1 unnamed protein product [Saprochaete ingens]
MPTSAFNADFAAGITAGAVTTLVVHPLDLIKVRLQVDASSADPWSRLRAAIFPSITRNSVGSSSINSININNNNTNTSTSIHTLRALYRGLPINLVGNTLSWGLYFSLYHYLKAQALPPGPIETLAPTTDDNKIIQPIDDNLVRRWAAVADSSTVYMACAMSAGTTTSLLTNPLWVLKTRYLSTTSDGKSTSSASRVNVSVRDIVAKEGVRALWRGFMPSLFGVLQGSLQFSLYDEFKTRRLRRREQKAYSQSLSSSSSSSSSQSLPTDKLAQWEYITLSASSKIVATVALYPYQLVRARLQMGSGYYKNAREIILHALRNEGGLRSLYKGLGANLLRVVPSTTITFVVYENVQHWLKH